MTNPESRPGGGASVRQFLEEMSFKLFDRDREREWDGWSEMFCSPEWVRLECCLRETLFDSDKFSNESSCSLFERLVFLPPRLRRRFDLLSSISCDAVKSEKSTEEAKENCDLFTLIIPNFDELCQGTEKAFSDLFYICDLPWQIFALTERDPAISEVSETNEDGSESIQRRFNKDLIVYLQCNGIIEDQKFEFGKTSPAYVIIPNSANNENDLKQAFTASIDANDYWEKINMGNVDQFFAPGFIDVDGSLKIIVKLSKTDLS